MQRMLRCYCWAPWMALAVLSLAGCSDAPALVPVKGSVKVDGKPAKGVVLTFTKVGAGMKDFPASAVTADDGTFSLSLIHI